MSDESKICQLIVRQYPEATGDLDELLKTLKGGFGLDPYTARQRLIGPGLAMFGNGGEEKTGRIAALLRRYGFACWQVEPDAPALTPSRLLSLEIRDEQILFACRSGTVSLQRGSAVVGVLADVSGGLIDKHVKRILAQNAYRGSESLEQLTPDEMVPIILQGQPVFDFYLLDERGQPHGAVRVLPGRFNHAGLGERGTISSRGNLEAILSLVEEYAEPYRFYCDFGLSQLPNCRVESLAESPAAIEHNLKSLSRYGWLMTRLRDDGRPPSAAGPDDETGTAVGVAAALVLGQPALAATLGGDGSVDEIPGLAEVAGELKQAYDESTPESKTQDAGKKRSQKDLPPPPGRPVKGTSLRKMLVSMGAIAGMSIMLAVMQGDHHLLRVLARYGTRAGVVPGLFAGGLLWAGLNLIRLKRQIENTPTSKIRSIAMGLVEVQGQARRLYALVSPMTQSACVYYRLRKYRRDDRDRWRLTSDVDSSHVAFLVDDGSGRVIVDPWQARVRAKTRQTSSPGQSHQTFIYFYGNDPDEKWIEDIIYEGTTLYVLGFAQPLKEERLSLRERTVAILRDLKLDRRALHRYDTDGDGQISTEEWQAARSDAEQKALREHLAEQAGRKRQEERVVIARAPGRGMPFVIAETPSEAHLTRNYGLLSVPLLVTGLALAGFSLYMLLGFLGL